MDPQTAPKRLQTLPSWLVNQLSATAHRLVRDRLHSWHGAHRYHFSMLAALEESGPMSQADLGRSIGLDRSDVTAEVSYLEGTGLIARMPDPADRRRNVVSVTEAGLRHLAEMERQVADVQKELLAPLSEEDRGEFVRLLTALTQHHQSAQPHETAE